MTTTEMEARPKQKVERREESTRPGRYFAPAVDILETNDEIVLLADMPGVPADAVDVHLDGDQLTIEGRVRPEDYAGLKPLHVEYVVGGYHRTFALGEAIDRDGIRAAMQQGVLTLHLPKAEHARVRRIEVSVG
ncbi:MAG TPA: Hsp20/alpha crystallin family protein [Candidatus Binatia bacterium]|nr:Hsp20/alpha crystallin family protein [Candidatus Binatia bacterium]